MAASKNESSSIAIRYARALFDLGQERNALDALKADLLAIRAVIAEKGPFASLLANPLVGREQGRTLVMAALEKAKAHELTRNFFGILAQNRRLDMATGAITAFLELVAQSKGEMTARVISAQAMDTKDKDALGAALSRKFGKTVLVDAEVDANLLGGFTVRVGGKMMDYSVRGKLDRLAQQLKSAPIAA